MGVVEKFNRWFRTKAFLRQESIKWTHTYFPETNGKIGQAVAYALVEMLGVDFNQLTPETDIVTDLKANEWWEWADIQMCLEENLGGYFPPQPGFSGRTITDLINFVSNAQLNDPELKPKRGTLSSVDWCFVECLKSSNSSKERG